MVHKVKDIFNKFKNLSFDIAIWLSGVGVGLVPAVIMVLLYPDDSIRSLSPFDRIFSDVEVVFAFLSGVALLIIEQFNVEDININARKLLSKSKVFYLIIVLLFMLLYICMKPFPIFEIEKLLDTNFILLNKTVVILSLAMALSLFITHSLSNPEANQKEVNSDELYLRNSN